MQSQGIDSAKAVFRRLSVEEKDHPERYFISRDVLLSVAAQRMSEGK